MVSRSTDRRHGRGALVVGQLSSMEEHVLHRQTASQLLACVQVAVPTRHLQGAKCHPQASVLRQPLR